MGCNKKTSNAYKDSFDLFAKPAPSFTIEGREVIHSVSGLIFSAFQLFFLLLLGVYFMKRALLHENPTIMEIKLYD